MPQITAVLIDSREPSWIQSLTFHGLPTTVTYLETGDILAVTDDGHTIVAERKTPSDFLNSLKDDRLMPQIARMMAARYEQQAAGEVITNWPYLVITEPFRADATGHVVTDRGVTGWLFSSVMGALLSIQEVGCGVVFSHSLADYQDCILRLGKRDRSTQMVLKPPRVAALIGPKSNFLSGLPGLGLERVQGLLDWSGNNVSRALVGLTALSGDAPPVGVKNRQHIRELFGLAANEELRIEKGE